MIAPDPLVSVIISSYNYARFLPEAIDSALAQTYPNVEVIVVDDASTDESPRIIAGYGKRIVPLLRPKNEGPSGACHAAFRASRGDIVCFLDSDDVLLPTAVERAVARFAEPGVAKVHWPLWEIDACGAKTGRTLPAHAPPGSLPEGDLRETILRSGPGGYASPPTSGNAWSRRFLEEALPVPPALRREGDIYLIMLAPLFGTIRALPEPQGCYRVHGTNEYAAMPAYDQSRRNLRIFERCCAALSEHLRNRGVFVDPARWREGNAGMAWVESLCAATGEIAALVPPGATFILVDEGKWGSRIFADRRSLPFVERDGRYWGPPPDDAAAIAEFERLRGLGAGFLVFAWPAFWWIEHYRGLAQHLGQRFPRILDNERVVVFDLRAAGGKTG